MANPSQIDEHIGLLDVQEDAREVVLGADAAEPQHYPPGTFRKIVMGMVTLVLLVTASYVVPGFHWAQPWTSDEPVPFWNVVGRELLGEGDQAEAAAEELDRMQKMVQALDETEARRQPGERRPKRPDGASGYTPHPDDELEVTKSLEDPSGKALDAFYARLALTDDGSNGAITRVVHWGDSAIGNDGITSAIRRRMQQRFGDAGHGFHLLQPPNASYKHQNVHFYPNGRWSKCFIIERCRKDGHYGLGGVTFHSVAGAESLFGNAKKGSFGRTVSRFELWYARQPRGGKIQLRVDRNEPQVIDTAADQLEDAWHVIEVADGEHQLRVRTIGGGKLRAYGVVLESNGPGVVWDGLSLIGAFTNRLSAQDPEHFHSQIRHRDPQLAVLMFGGNDMIRASMTMEQYAAEYTEVLKLVRGAKEDMGCVVMAPLDHGVRKGSRILTRPIVPKMVAAQRNVALAQGCAFFDTYAAMGGEGSIGRWRRVKPPLASGDLAHLTPRGHKMIGELLYRALIEGYVEYRKRTAGG
jgi:lysophospholipase L1-like esterase